MNSGRTPIVIFAAGVACLVVGCSSDDHVYKMSATNSCMRSKGLAASPDTNPFADTSGGALKIAHGDYSVFVTFAADSSAAKRSETRLKALAVGFGAEASPDDLVKRRGNVVYYSNGGEFPDEAQRQVVDCLR